MHIWQIACRAKAVRRQPVRVIVNGRPVVVFRTGTNGFAALEDRCAHRNAPLSKGRVCEGRIECGYHGWQYGADGRVAHIPALPPGEACPQLSVERFHALEQDGFVWIAAGEQRPSQPPPSFAGAREPGWTHFVMQTRFHAGVEACLENFLDCPHAAFVHRYWFRAPMGKPVRVSVRTLADGAVAEFFEEPRKKSLVWWLLAPKRGTMRHTDRYVVPSMSRVDYEFPSGLKYIISSSCTERTSRETEVYTVIAFKWGWLGPLIRLYFEPLSRWIIRQDVQILAAQQATIAEFGGARFASTRADVLGKHIVAWRQALRAGSPGPEAGAEETLSIRL